MKPQVVMPDYGVANKDLTRVPDGKAYRDLSTVIVTPTRGGLSLSPRVMQSWMSLMKPMNQHVYDRLWMAGMEVGEAYNHAVELILANPQLSKFKYMLTVEDDVIPPPDGLLRLYEGIYKSPYAVVAGIYWTKGEGQMPMIYGDPNEHPKTFRPQKPLPDRLQECNGLGMGFNLFKLDMFKRVPKPWFKTLQEYTPGQGGRAFTQDLYFYERAGAEGFKFACDTRVKCGHYDYVGDKVW